VLDVTAVPSVREAFDALGDEDRRELQDPVRSLPLTRLLTRLRSQGDGRSDAEQRALALLARAAIKHFDRPRDVYERLVDLLLAPDQPDVVPVAGLVHGGAVHAPLLLTMIETLAWTLALGGCAARGRAWLDAAAAVAASLDLPGEEIAVHDYRARYELAHGDTALASGAVARAGELAATRAPALVERIEDLAAFVAVAQAAAGLLTDVPPALDGSLRRCPDALLLLLVSLGEGAVARDDLAVAVRFAERAAVVDAGRAGGPDLRLLLLRAKLARRTGQYERADLLLAEVRTAARRAEVEDDLAWETFSLARDLAQADAAGKLPAHPGGPPGRATYQRGVLAVHDGETELAASLFRACAADAVEPNLRLDASAMLAMVTDDRVEAMRLLYRSIGAYVAGGRRQDHAIALGHLGLVTLIEARARLAAGIPAEVIPELSRAARLYRDAIRIHDELGAEASVIDSRLTLAAVAEDAADLPAALEQLELGIDGIEAQYLLVADAEAAAAIAQAHRAWYERAVTVCLRLAQPARALGFAERAKSRRLLRDRADLLAGVAATPGAAADPAARAAVDIAAIRRRLRTYGRASVAERRRLLESAKDVVARSAGDGGGAGMEPEPRRWYGSGSIVCRRCLVDNAVGSMFCSACEELLVKTATADLTLEPTEESARRGLATLRYNQGQREFHEQRFAAAEALFRQALQHRRHQDYLFFLALCLLARDEPAEAVAALSEMFDLQFAAVVPAWYSPVAPTGVHAAVADLTDRRRPAGDVLVALIEQEVDAIRRQRSLPR
jgi:hypothetical protein